MPPITFLFTEALKKCLLFHLTGSGTVTPTAPSTPTNHCEDQVSKSGITLPSAATVARALSPLLTPAFAAANNMALRASKMRQDPGAATSNPAASTASNTVTTSPATATGAATTVPSSPYANEMAVQDLPTMTQVRLNPQRQRSVAEQSKAPLVF